MPMKKRKSRKIRPEISPAFYKYLSTGTYEVEDEGAGDVFLLQGNKENMIAAWNVVRDEFMAAWGKEHSGKIPWAALHLEHREDERKGKDF
jgi:dTDP-glucose pyrophosphorylase